ncbi:MAG: AN1-type zinc finger protein [Candidatus Hodarchaeota archaeon]
MNLHSKFLTGFAVIGLICLISFFLIPGSPLILYVYYDFSPLILGALLTTFGIFIFVIGIIFYILLYSPERIKGIQADYEISPDLTKFKAIPYSQKASNISSEEIPERGFCSSCGREVYKPFRCGKCGQILCGKHFLPGEHSCKEEIN